MSGRKLAKPALLAGVVVWNTAYGTEERAVADDDA